MTDILFKERVERGLKGRFISTSKKFNTIEDLRIDFYSRVDIQGLDDCWNWKEGKTGLGYGQYCYGNRVVYSHVFSWMLEYGDIPKGFIVLHKCDNPSCVNLRHLLAATQRDNMIDKVNKGRDNSSRGSNSGRSKLHEDDIVEIREIYSKGNISHRKIADMYGISNRNVSSIVNRETWKHVK